MYFTSGAYVRISRSRIALSPLCALYSRQRDWVSSASATRERIRAVSALPQRSVGHRGEPDGQGDRSQGDHPARSDVPGSVRCRERDADETDCEQRKECAQRPSLVQGAENLTATILPP